MIKLFIALLGILIGFMLGCLYAKSHENDNPVAGVLGLYKDEVEGGYVHLVLDITAEELSSLDQVVLKVKDISRQ
jgi:hypothetical protein